jgi:ABC-2 type transport system ATP-binding protein
MIRAERLSKSHGGVHALTDVTFEVARGEAVAISGALGSTPSTLLRILATLVTPTSGTLDIGGVDAIAAPFEARRKLFWSGTPALTSELSVTEYLELAGAGRRRHRLEPARRSAILARTGLASADIPLSTLPAGQRRLVDLAAAVLSEAELVLIDEPFGAAAATDLHPDRTAWLSLFAEARGRGATVVLATTDAAIPGICDRLLPLEAVRAA